MNTAPSVSASALTKLRPRIATELHRRAISGELGTPEALRQTLHHLFVSLFGAQRGREDEIRFLIYAAPIARRVVIEVANASDPIGLAEVRMSDVREWLGWLDVFDPLCARMIDLHYFAGLSTKETAHVLRVPAQTVIRDLRFAKAWLQTKL